VLRVVSLSSQLTRNDNVFAVSKDRLVLSVAVLEAEEANSSRRQGVE
jgi:hypothetical protein